jgi:phosphatidylserine decarboxylase
MKYTIAKEAYPYIILCILSGICALLFSLSAGIFFFVIAIYIAYFFRKPLFSLQTKEGEVISPAWGKITSIENIIKEGKKYKKISIFLSIFDVHLQCVPCKGTIHSVSYKKGHFLNALKPESAMENEQNSLVIRINQEEEIHIRQIAGLIARRILCWVHPGDIVRAGDYFGLIQFGSRVEIEVPDFFELLVKTGQKVYGGKTLLSVFPAPATKK